MWRIWYADTTYSSDDGPPESAPGFGVQVIGQPDRTPGAGNVGYVTLRGYDWWMWHLEDEAWFGVMGDSAMHLQLLTRQPITGICVGMRIPDERFHAIRAEAEEWARQMNLPAKNGVRPEEVI